MKLDQLPFKLNIEKELKSLKKEKKLTLVNVGNSAAKSFLLSEISKKSDFKNILWASTDEKADQLFLAAHLWFGESIVSIPKKVSTEKFYEIKNHLESPQKNIFLFEDWADFLKKPFPTPEVIKSLTLNLEKDQKIEVYPFFEALESKGYTHGKDDRLNPGEFLRKGENIFLYPMGTEDCIRIELFGENIEKIEYWNQDKKKGFGKDLKSVEISPASFSYAEENGTFKDWLSEEKNLFIADDLEKDSQIEGNFNALKFTTFPENDEIFFHLNFFSVLPFYTIPDFVVDVKERLRREFQIVIFTKKKKELEYIFSENNIMYSRDLKESFISTVTVVDAGKEDFLPHSFQNNSQDLFFLTDREIFQFKRSARKKKVISDLNLDLMTSLKSGDYVVHLDHGIAKFNGMERRKLLEDEREYLKLEYLGNDRLFVPVESAEKVSKFVGDTPTLTKLGGTQWQKLQKKLKVETEKMAKELLKIYANRKLAKGRTFGPNDDMMNDFCDSFPYELTPGQSQTWEDIRVDMEKPKPMDRLVCGDVGFGKTEMAMRSAFKCFRAGMQCAFLAPITILAEQHFQSFLKRVSGKNYGVKIERLSRFQTAAEQKQILKDLEFGLVDIVIGTHRLLSNDVKFKKLGLLIIDEEQRFGVKQKEKFKKLKSECDILTMTATPIPRTLHLGLNKLKDISTITTPPPGRLPVVTEVRRYNLDLIRDRIKYEIERGGQVYFLHNQVKTIESYAVQLKSLVPDARFIVAHGQMTPQELEKRINSFKNHEADVLIASTIIENGIDLPNANTLFVNHAEKFGLSQLYQLRGRVGRGRTQAYSYFLYQGQRLAIDAKKRLRAIVEASDLGSGFQIAMKDLEIRGAGEILGASQSGSMKDAGVSHFVRMLNKTVEKMKNGEISQNIEEEDENISVEVPLSAFIPPHYIPNTQEKIQTYQSLAGSASEEELQSLKKNLEEDYGPLPVEVENLSKVIRLKILLRKAFVSSLKIKKNSHKSFEIVLQMGKNFKPDQIFGLLKNSPKKWVFTATSIKLELNILPITWYRELLEEIGFLIPEKKEVKKSPKKTPKKVKTKAVKKIK